MTSEILVPGLDFTITQLNGRHPDWQSSWRRHKSLRKRYSGGRFQAAWERRLLGPVVQDSTLSRIRRCPGFDVVQDSTSLLAFDIHTSARRGRMALLDELPCCTKLG